MRALACLIPWSSVKMRIPASVTEHFQAEGAEEADQADEGLGDGEERRRMDSMEAKDMAGRLGMIQTIISEVAEELLSLSRDDLEVRSLAVIMISPYA